jgi:hypothetical protein
MSRSLTIKFQGLRVDLQHAQGLKSKMVRNNVSWIYFPMVKLVDWVHDLWTKRRGLGPWWTGDDMDNRHGGASSTHGTWALELPGGSQGGRGCGNSVDGGLTIDRGMA